MSSKWRLRNGNQLNNDDVDSEESDDSSSSGYSSISERGTFVLPTFQREQSRTALRGVAYFAAKFELIAIFVIFNIFEYMQRISGLKNNYYNN